jgi:AraC family transcriptional regulator
MENMDEVGGRGGSQTLGEERIARYVVDRIPESAGPRKVITRRSGIHSIRGPGSQKFLAKEHSARIVLAAARKPRASLGSDPIKEFDAPTGSLANPAGVDSSLARSKTRGGIAACLEQDMQWPHGQR